MAEQQPTAGQLTGDSAAVPPTGLTWAAARQRLVEGNTYLLATVRPDGRPHVVPMVAPTVVFAFGKEKGFSATRWRF